MKKIFTLLLIITTFFTAYSQDTNTGKYVSLGSSYSANTFTYGGEFGFYNDKTWLGFLVETYKGEDNKYETYVGVKPYYKVFKFNNFIDSYLYGSMKVGLIKTNPLQFEVGNAMVINLSDKVAIQYNTSFVKYEYIKELNLSFGLGLNYYF